MPEGAASAGMQANRDADAQVEGQGSQRIDVDSEVPDESETIAPLASPERSVDVAELAGPPGLPGPLYDPAPKGEDGRTDWERLHALVVAVEALVAAGMTSEARPLLGQLRGIVEAARGPSAKVIDIGVERSRRES